MAKLTLEFEQDYDFDVIGIASHVKDYRLSWELNNKIGLDLQKDEDFEVSSKSESQLFSFFQYIDEDNHQEYYLINNRGGNGFLIPEEKKADYLLILKGVFIEDQIEHLTKQIASIKSILTTYFIEVSGLKSKANLLF